MQQTCGNCGKPVGGSDITCPHCDALLAAYASPIGSSPTTEWDASALDTDAIPPVRIDEPAPPAKIDIPDKVETGSSAPRPLFDTNVTIEELKEAAEGDHDENLVVVAEEEASSNPVVFDGPDYARPPSDAEPVPIVEDADEQMIARPSPTAKTPSNPDTTSENRLAGASEQVTPARSVRKQRPTLEERRAQAERGQTGEYLRRLHATTGYESGAEQLSQSVDTRTRPPAPPIVNTFANDETIRKSRQGCLGLLYIMLFFLWMGVVGGLLDGDLRSGTILLAIALSFVVRLVHAVPGNVRTR